MNQDTSDAGHIRKTAPVYLVWSGEMMFDAPLERAWTHVINYPSWQNYSTVKHITGEVGKEGEVVLLSKDEKGFEFPPYFARTIKLEPPHRVIWKTYPEKSSPGNEFFGIVEFRLDEVDGKTRYWFQSLYEFLVPYENEDELDQFRKQQDDNMSTLYESIYPKLRKLIEQRR